MKQLHLLAVIFFIANFSLSLTKLDKNQLLQILQAEYKKTHPLNITSCDAPLNSDDFPMDDNGVPLYRAARPTAPTAQQASNLIPTPRDATFRNLNVTSNFVVGGNSTFEGNSVFQNSVTIFGDLITTGNAPGVIKNELVVTKGAITSANQFNSINAALASITDNSPTNPYVIFVGPGIFAEDTIYCKPFVTIMGEGQFNITTITTKSPNQNLIVGAPAADIEGVTLSGATGAGYAAVTYSGEGAFRIFNCRFGSNDTLVKFISSGSTYNAINCQLCSITINGTFTTGFDITDNGVAPAVLFLANFTWFSQVPVAGIFPPSTFMLVQGTRSGVIGSNLNIGFVPLPSSTGFLIQNGAYVSINAARLSNFDTLINVPDVGAAPDIDFFNITTEDNTNDIIIDNPNTTGSFFGTFTAEKVSINPAAQISFFALDPNAAKTVTIGPMYVGNNISTVTNITPLVQQSAAIGEIEGTDVLTDGGGLTLNIAPGAGYLMVGVAPNDDLMYTPWTAQSLILPDDTTSFIYIDNTGTAQSNVGSPNFIQNIYLGKATTNAGSILYIQETPRIALHPAAATQNFLTSALGNVYTSGSVVLKNGFLQLDVSSGNYFYGINEFFPSGGTAITFIPYVGSQPQTATNTVDYQNYDNGGVLTPIPVGQFARHELFVEGDGAEETYLLVYGQTLYPTFAAAETGSNPLPPATWTDNICPIASIIVENTGTPNASSISEIRDERPRVGFSASAVSTTADHNSLLNLTVGDAHPQYVRTDGTRVLAGNLQMGGNQITNSGLINGVTIQAHAARHLPNGADPLPVGTPVTIATTNSQGIQNIFARSDHIHAHGAQTDPTLHAIATESANGFMSSNDKTKLDNLNPGNFVQITGSTMTGTLTISPSSASTALIINPAGATSPGITITTTSGNALNINSGAFTVAGNTGNTATTGTLSVSGNTGLGVTPDGTHALLVNGLTSLGGATTVTSGGLTVSAGGATITGATTINTSGGATTTLGDNGSTGSIVNIANGTGGNTVSIANGANTVAQTVNISGGNAAANSTVNILSGAATSGTQTLNLATGTGIKTVNIANTAATANTINIGGTTSTTTAGGNLTVNGTFTANGGSSQIGNFTVTNGNVIVASTTNTATAQDLDFTKNRAGLDINSGDTLGTITFQGQGGGMQIVGSQIKSISSGTIALNRVASDLEFFTHPDSTTASTQRMIINSAGNVTINTPDSGTALTINGGGQTITAGGLTVTAGGTNISGNSILNGGSLNMGTDATDNAVNIGTNASSGRTITIGNTTGTTSMIARVGTGNYSLDGAGASTYSVGASTTSGTITMGGTAQTGALTLGQSTATNTIALGNSSGTTTINIANGINGNTINMGNGANTSSQIINVAAGASAASSTVNILSGTATGGAQTLNLATGASSKTVNIANTASTTNSINIGGTTSTTTVGGNLTVNGTLTTNGGSSQTGNFTVTNGNLTVASTANAATAQDLDFTKNRAGLDITSGDALGTITFQGQAGGAQVIGSQIKSISSGTIALNRVASDLEFFTHPDSTVSSTQRMIINSAGNVTINTPDSGPALTISGGGATITAGGLTVTAGGAIISGNSTLNSGLVNMGTDATDNAINVGTGASSGRTITIGNATGSTGINERVGTGNFSLDGVGASTYTIGASTTGGTITIGGTAQTGTLTLGQSTATNTIAIGNSAGTTTINIANGTNGNTLSLGNGANTITQTINIANGASAANSTVSILSGAGTAGAASLLLADNPRVTTIDLGNVAPAATRITTINGGNAAANDTVNILAGNPSAGTQTVNILSGTATGGTQILNLGTGASAKTVTIGNTTGSTSIIEHVGTGNYSLDGVGASTYTIGTSTTSGTITVGGTAQSGTLTLGQSTATNTIAIGNNTGITTVNIANGINGNTIAIGNGSNTSAQTVNIAAGNAAASSTVNIMTGVATGGVQTLNLATGSSPKTVNIANAATTANTINIGGTTSTTTAGGNFTVNGTFTANGGSSQTGNLTVTNGNITVASTTATATAQDLDFTKNRSGGDIISGDTLGTITFQGQGGGVQIIGSQIKSVSSGTIALNRVASDLEFFTHPDSTIASTQRMVINSAGNVTLNTPDSGTALTVNGGGQVITSGGLTISAGGANVTGNSTLNGGSVNIGTDTTDNAINVGTGASSGRAITIGNITGSTGITQQIGTGNFSLDGVGASTYTVGASTTSGTITIGGIAQTGTLTLGQSTATNAIAIGNNAGATTVNIANGTNGNTLSLGNGANASAQTINIANGASAANSTVSILSGAGTAGAASLLLADNPRVITIDLGNIAPAAARITTINGGNAAVNDTINIMSGNPSAGTQTVNVLSGVATGGTQVLNLGTGASAKAITVGNTTGATSITERVGTGNYSLDGVGASIYAIGASTTGGTITIGGTAQTGTLTLGQSTATNTIAMGNSAGVTTVNIANGINGNTIAIGNGANTSAQTINIANGASTANSTVSILSGAGTAGSASLLLADNPRVATIDLGNVAPAATRITTLNGGNAATNDTVNILAGNPSAGTQTVNILSGVATGGTQALNLGTGASAKTITLGNTTSTTGIIQQVGTGNFSLDGVGASTYTIGASTTGGTITIGGTAQTGTLTLGQSTATNTISIGNNAGATTVNIANGTNGNTVALGNGANASAQTINIANGASAANSTVSILSGAGTAGAASLLLADNPRVTTIDLGNIAPAATRITTINGGNAAANDTVNILAGNPSLGTQTVNILSGVATGGTQALNLGTGASAKTVTIGNTTSTTGIIQQVGTGNFSLDGVGASTYTIGASTTGGTITIGGTAQTGTLTLGQSTATNTIAIGNNAGATTVNIANGTNGNTIALGSGANASAQTINIANGASAANSTVSILSGAGTAGAASLLLADNPRVTTIDLGNIAPAAARSTTLNGGNATVNDTVNILSGNPSAGTQTVNILSGVATGGTQALNLGTGASAKTIAIGNNTGASTVNVNTGTGGFTVNSGGTVGLNVNANAVTTYKSNYKMHAYRATTQTIPANTATTIIFSTSVFDPNGNYSTTTGLYTAPVTGVYLVSTAIATQTAAQPTNDTLSIQVGGATVPGYSVLNTMTLNAITYTLNLSALVSATAGQTIGISYTANKAETIQNNGNYLSIHFMSN